MIKSFHKNEVRDYEAICSIIDRDIKGNDVVIISNDPYLLTFMFVSLIRYNGISIHILNPAEGIGELQRLLYTINPDCVFSTTKDVFIGYPITIINGNLISKEHRYDVDEPLETNFTLTTYSPSPVKIHKISGDMFAVMVNSLNKELESYEMTHNMNIGCIPFISLNPDYLLYYVALKLHDDAGTILPTHEDTDLPILNKDLYLAHNRAETIFIPKAEFNTIWSTKINSIFEYKYIFKAHLKNRWYVNLLIKRRLKSLFKGFNKLVIIGNLENAYQINILKNLSFLKVYTILPIRSAMLYGPICNTFGTLSPDANKRFVCASKYGSSGTLHLLNLTLSSDDIIHYLIDVNSRFIKGKSLHDPHGYNVEQYTYMGNVENSFRNQDAYIFPETLEKVINSYPFIRNSALLTFNKKMTLVVNPDPDILDANRINFKMFSEIIHKQINLLNKELPDDYKIINFVVSTTLIEQDRQGEIVRYPFNYCNKM